MAEVEGASTEAQPIEQAVDVPAEPKKHGKSRRASLILAESTAQLSSLSSEQDKVNDMLKDFEALLASSRLQSSGSTRFVMEEVKPLKHESDSSDEEEVREAPKAAGERCVCGRHSICL